MDALAMLVDDLRRRQLTALHAEMPEMFAGHTRRMSDATLTGVRIVNDLANNAAWLQKLIGDLVTIAERDPRFAFLSAIPEAPILSMSRALALERSVFGEESREVAELSLLMGIFTVILDGLLDEAPSELRPSRSWLDAVMEPSRWGDAVPPPELELAENPVTETLRWTTREVIHRLVKQHGWRRDSIVREQFSNATRAAYSAELESVHCRITEPTMTIAESRRRVLAKSTSPIWAGALIPFCVHGWPANIDPGEFADLARAMGAFSGWLDDIVDVAVDLRADRWSMVLFELNDVAQSLPTQPSRADARPALVETLQIPFVRGQLAFFGLDRLHAIRAAMPHIGLVEAQILPALADVSQACLTDGIGKTAA